MLLEKKLDDGLNLSTETKLMQVSVNLERLRWLNFDFGNQYILINQANYEAKYVNDNLTIWQSKVVIGLPDYQTAEFFDQMTYYCIIQVGMFQKVLLLMNIYQKFKKILNF